MSKVAAGTEDDFPEKIRIEPPITVRGLSEKIERQPYVLIEDLMNNGKFYSMNMEITQEDIEFLGREYHIKVRITYSFKV